MKTKQTTKGQGKPELPEITLSPTEDHNRTILVSNIPTNFPKTGVREFKMTLGYVYNNTNDGNMAGKAVALDSHVIPAIYQAFKAKASAEALAEALEQFVRYADNGKHPEWADYMLTIAGDKMRAALAAYESEVQ